MSVDRQSVKQIIEAIGGADNISTATHCVTRLRLILKDEGKVDKDKLDDIDIVKGSSPRKKRMISLKISA